MCGGRAVGVGVGVGDSGFPEGYYNMLRRFETSFFRSTGYSSRLQA